MGGTTAPGGRYYRCAPRYYRSAVLPQSLRYYRDIKSSYSPDTFTLFISSGILHLISSVCSVVAMLGWSGDGSRQHLKRKAAGGSVSTSVKKTAQKNKAPQVPIDVLPVPQYRSYRRVSPYREEQDPSLVGTKF